MSWSADRRTSGQGHLDVTFDERTQLFQQHPTPFNDVFAVVVWAAHGNVPLPALSLTASCSFQVLVDEASSAWLHVFPIYDLAEQPALALRGLRLVGVPLACPNAAAILSSSIPKCLQ